MCASHCACWLWMVCVWSAPTPHRIESNWAAAANQHGLSPWPQIRATCLMDTHSHEMLDAKLGAMDCGELSLAAQLRGEDHSVTLFDRAYFSAAFLLDWQAAGTQRHWLMRAGTICAMRSSSNWRAAMR